MLIVDSGAITVWEYLQDHRGYKLNVEFDEATADGRQTKMSYNPDYCYLLRMKNRFKSRSGMARKQWSERSVIGS